MKLIIPFCQLGWLPGGSYIQILNYTFAKTHKMPDPLWESNCLETSFHILYKCRYFSTLRRKVFLKHTIQVNKLFTSNNEHTINRIIEFATKAKFLDKAPQIRKRDLSPNRIISVDKRKRYNTIPQPETM